MVVAVTQQCECAHTNELEGFARGSVVKKPPASVEDMDSIPDQRKIPTHTQEQPGLSATTVEPVL